MHPTTFSFLSPPHSRRALAAYTRHPAAGDLRARRNTCASQVRRNLVATQAPEYI